MRRLAILTILLTALSVVGSLGFLRAVSDDGHPFATTWCDSPVVISLAGEGVDGVVTPADGVSVARGAEVSAGTRGPAIRLNGAGSRAQIDFGQTLFHTQWLFSNVTAGDAVRVDAVIGSASQQINASSVRGALTAADAQPGVGLVANAIEVPAGTAEIDVFTGATGVLFTNEGGTPLEVIAAIGCPALEMDAEQLSPPTWDEESQRFVAEHQVTIQNQLANTRLRALRSSNRGVSSTVVDDISINLDLTAAGFSAAELIDVAGVGDVNTRLNDDFDGTVNTALLAEPLSLTDATVQEFTFSVAYVPDFEDPAWAEGIAVPAPQISLVGRVDSIQVAMTANLGSQLGGADGSVSPSLLVTPEPGIVLDLSNAEEPALTSDGRIQISHEVTLTNNGETAVDNLAVAYPLVEMFGPGTFIESVSAVGRGTCAVPASDVYNGDSNATVLFDADGIDVGEQCTISLEALVIPGIQPIVAGTTYDAPLTVTARSGARTVQDVSSMRARLFQEAEFGVEVTNVEVTNLKNGSHSVDGVIEIENSGPLDLNEISVLIDVRRPADAAETEAADAPDGVAVPVTFAEFVGDERCVGAGAPGRAVSSAFVGGGVSLPAASSCAVEFSFVAFPGQFVEGWDISVNVSNPFTAVQPELAEVGLATVGFPESPAIDSEISILETINNADGTYTVRSESTITNTGDTPLVAVVVADSFAETFGEQLLAHERVGDSCTGVSTRFPVPTSPIAPDANTCSVTHVSVLRPGADLDGDAVTVDATATSTALVEVTSSATSETISFFETTRLISLISVESVERIDQETVAFVLSGTIENTGDIEARNAQVALSLNDAFDLESGAVPYEVVFLAVDGLGSNEVFNGSFSTGLLLGEETIPAGASISFRLLINASPGDEPGPYRFGISPTATSPSGADFSVRDSSDSTTVPVIGIVARSLETENNNNGTYSITHSVTAENAGTERLSSIEVFTGFDDAFGRIATGEIDLVSTCTSSVAAGEQCEVTRSVTVRPGSDIGPYDVPVSIAATSNDAVEALVIPEASVQTAGQPDSTSLTFDEDPGVQVATNVGEIENNGDGTYSLTYDAEVTNTGDVPLYLVGLNDFVTVTYEDRVVADQIISDTCALVTFENSLSPDTSCEQTRTVTIRPLADLGPWDADIEVSANSPSFAVVEGEGSFDSVTFTEDVSIDVEATLGAGVNNGNGTYTPVYELVLTNTGDVPLIAVSGANETTGFADSAVVIETLEDSCGIISFESPLLPGTQCRVEQQQLVSVGTVLGPFSLNAEVTARSASGEVQEVAAATNELTFTESPEIELESSVVSVESTGAGQFRVVMDLLVRNGGDVQLDDLELQLDLEEVFPNIAHSVEGIVSNDLVISEGFTASESENILFEGQSIAVGSESTITLVLAVEPGTDVGPFVGDLRAEGTSPASQNATSVINVSLELPSVAVAFLAQSTDNNQDGSYNVTSSYEITNDGTTDLEFIQLTEDLGTIFAGTNVDVVSIDSDTLATADPTNPQRGNNLVELGESLRAGTRAVITSVVVVEPGNNLGPFQPVVTVQGAAPTGTEAVAEATAARAVEFVERPALRIEQKLASRAFSDGERFDFTFAIDLINDGDVELRGLQVREDLLQTLGGGSRIVIRDLRSETLTVNRRFDGLGSFPNADGSRSTSTRDIGDTRLLSGGDTLAAGATETIELDVTITPETRGVYTARAVVTARSPSGADLGGGDREIEANTITRMSVLGELGVAKQVIDDAVLQSDGSIAVSYEILVENAGPFPLDNVTVHDRLSQAFGLGSEFETSPVRVAPGSPCDGFASPTYDGGAFDSVLASGFALQSGERCRIQFDAVVMPSIDLPGPYRSSAFAIATDPFSGTVLDDSTDGTNIDPDGNQEPGDNDIATPVIFDIPEPTISLGVETLASGALDASGRYELQYLVTLENTGAINVRLPRLVADLDEQWDSNFDVLSVVAEGIEVNDSFNGKNETNLFDRRTEVTAGEAYEIILTVRATQPDSGALTLDLAFDGVSVTGAGVVSELAAPVEALGPDGALQTTLFDTLTTEEKRLLGLGAAVILLFFFLFARSLVRKVRSFNNDDVVQSLAAADETEPDDDGIHIDLVAEENVRPRAPVIDLSEPSLRGRRGDDYYGDDHHRARRRQGRRPQRQND